MRFGYSDQMRESYFLSQPHQPFFVTAFINAIVGMLLFALGYKGVLYLSIPSGFYHAYTLIFLVFTPAFTAFLFTTFPRFSATEPIAKPVYLNVLTLFYFGSTLFVLGAVVSPFLGYVGAILVLTGHLQVFRILRSIYLKTAMPDKHDIYWILVAMGLGVAAHLLTILSMLFLPTLYPFAIQTAIYLYLFGVTITVAQRMVPFFSHVYPERRPYFVRNLFILAAAHVISESLYAGAGCVPDTLLAIYSFTEIRRWKLPFPNPNPLLWVLHLSLFWVPTAFAMSALAEAATLLGGFDFLYLGIHALALGFVFTILIGFGTRVTLGHSGNRMEAHHYEVALFYATQLVVIARLALSVFAAYGYDFRFWFDLAVTAWIILLSAWAWRFFPVLIYGKRLTKER